MHWTILAISLVLTLSSGAHATLVSIGGGVIYDDVSNVYWAKDANLAAGSSYDDGAVTSDGMMSWQNAKAWAEQLVLGGFDDWRLPSMTDSGSLGCQNGYSGQDCGYNVDTSGSMLAYMFHVNLGNLAAYDASGAFRGGVSGVTWGLVNTGPFDNLEPQFLQAEFWSDKEDALDPTLAWYFSLDYGYQGFNGKSGEFHAWAVRGGTTGRYVPAPHSLALIALGLAGIGFSRRKAKSVRF